MRSSYNDSPRSNPSGTSGFERRRLARRADFASDRPALTQLAVARRGEVVADCSAAAELTGAQHNRLTQVLSRIYGRPVSVQLQIDPKLLGGLTVSVSDDVIDGTLSSRLTAARNRLPD